MLIAVLGVGTLSAQTWTSSKVSAGTFYLYNVGANKFLCSGNNFGSHASVAEGGIPVTLAGSNNVYTISTTAIYKDKYLNGEWMDGETYDWTFEEIGDGIYKIKNGENVLYWNGGTSTNTTLGTDPGTDVSQWKLVTEENRVEALSAATQSNPIDVTFLIKNAYFAKGNGHYFVRSGSLNSLSTSTSWKGTDLTDFWGYDSSGEDACYAIEQYGKTFDNYQELTVPNGKYFMTAKGFYRGDVIPYIYANDQKCDLKVKGELKKADGTVNDGIESGAIALRGDDYLLDGVTVVVTNGSLRVGVKSDANINWCVFDDFKLVYYGIDLTIYENALSSTLATAQNIEQTKLNTTLKNTLNDAIAEAQSKLNDVNRTVESLETAIKELEPVISLANNSISIYAGINGLLTTCNDYTANSTPATAGDKTTFKDAIDLASEEKENAATVEALSDVYNALEKARQVYVLKSYPTDDVTFDMTFKIQNAEVASKDGWTTNANLANNVDYDGAPDVHALDLWHWGAMAVYANQTISNLPDGVYTLTAMARTNGADKCYVYATSGDVEYKEVVVGGGDTGNPWGLVSVPNILVSNGSPMTIGLKGDIDNTWFSVDNFTLTLLRDLNDEEKLDAAKKNLKSTIDAVDVLNTTKNIGEGVFEIPTSAVEALEDAIFTSQNVYSNESATTADLERTNTDLLAAIDAYKNVELNGPSVDERFYITIVTPGHGRLNCPVIAALGSVGTNNLTGYTFYAAGNFENYRPTVFTLTKVSGNLYNISVELEEGTVYLTYGSLNGSPAGWNKSQIQGTTNVDAKGTFKIEASSVVDGGIRIVNTETGKYLDCENNADKNYPIYSGSHDTYEFALVDASEVTTSIVIDAEVQLATCVLLFDAELPANLKAYTTETLENGYLNLVEVDKLEAYKPYILYAENGYEGELSGKVDLAGYQLKVTDDNGLLAGAVETQVITYGYALQNQTGENGKGVAFYAVDTENSQEVTIPAGKCWLDVQKNSNPAATTRSISLRFPEGGATGIGDVKIELPADGSAPIYTIDGKRVDVMQCGQIYIIGGKKMIKK